MKFLVILSVAVACAAAVDLKDDSNAPILKSSYEGTPDGAFQYIYETGNGIAAQAQGVVKNPNNEYPSIEVTGGFKYTSPDGTPIEISYIANEFGYQPSGPAIPTPHPIPEYIARSIAYIAAHPAQESVKLAKAASYPLQG